MSIQLRMATSGVCSIVCSGEAEGAGGRWLMAGASNVINGNHGGGRPSSSNCWWKKREDQETFAPIDIRDILPPIGVPIINELMNNVHVPCADRASVASLSTSNADGEGLSAHRNRDESLCAECNYDFGGRWRYQLKIKLTVRQKVTQVKGEIFSLIIHQSSRSSTTCNSVIVLFI